MKQFVSHMKKANSGSRRLSIIMRMKRSAKNEFSIKKKINNESHKSHTEEDESCMFADSSSNQDSSIDGMTINIEVPNETSDSLHEKLSFKVILLECASSKKRSQCSIFNEIFLC